MTRPIPALLGRAAFLATSWTWCIGMFLPVILLRDFGPLGFAIFAIPNIAGAAALGWVLSQSGARELLQRHRPLVLAFSTVTVAFQAWFLLTFVLTPVGPLGPMPGMIDLFAWPLVPAHVCFVSALALAWSERTRAAAGALAWLGSVACIVGYFLLAGTAPPIPTAALPAPAVLAMAPCCALGFLLCPYLDATFLALRRDADQRDARATFTLGFGLFFAVMIAFTAVYSAVPNLGGSSRAAVVVHLIGQLCFTIAVHVAAAWRLAPAIGRAAVVIGAAVLTFAAAALTDLAPHLTRELAPQEVIYRLFMGGYGLLFPAYVYVCVIPYAHPVSARRAVLMWALAVAAASAFFYSGFVERETLRLLPGILIVLLARPALRLLPAPPAR
ncbi:MAG: hypothetical protein ACT4PL_06560 [Phycisphaerales bacterium]